MLSVHYWVGENNKMDDFESNVFNSAVTLVKSSQVK